MRIKATVEKTRTGYSAFAEDLPVYTTGKDLESLKVQIIEALNLYFEDTGRIITERDLKIQLDLPQFFSFCKVINAKALSERIGMNQTLLAQYIKGHKRPSGTNGLYEIRIEWESNTFRIFCFFEPNNTVVLCSGFVKKTQKTPVREISKALNIMKGYYEEKAK